MVQITRARYTDPKTGEEKEIAAGAFDKDSHGKLVCKCPDKNCGAILTHHRSHMQNFYSEETGDPYVLKIAAHFQRSPKSPPHDERCTAVDDYTKFQIYARQLGGLSLQKGAFVYNLNIPTDNKPAPLRQRVRILSQSFERARQPVQAEQDHDRTHHQVLSEGLNHIKKMTGLLDKTEFDPEYRESILLRQGRRQFTLAGVYKSDPIDFFREEHARAKRGGLAAPVLVQFRPIAIGKFHSKKHRTIQGISIPVHAPGGKAYSVSVMLHLGSEEQYKEIKSHIKNGKRSFAVFAREAYVDLIEFAHKKKEIEGGTQKDRSVFVHVHIERPEQIMAWTPLSPQHEMSFDHAYNTAPSGPGMIH